MAGIYKAYDIRGVYPTELNEQIAFNIGRAFVDFLKNEPENKNKKEILNIAIGKDMRLSSPALFESIVKGVISQGANVTDIGLASTTEFYHAVSMGNFDGGLEVTASHNPTEYNGIKIVKANAYPIGYDTGINEIERKINENNFEEENENPGIINIKEGYLDSEINHAIKFSKVKLDEIKPFKVVADVANSMGAPYLEKLFEKLPCELVKMNFKLDGTFPSHQADPFQDKNVADLKKRVISEKANLGIATDGDADRIFFIDDKGEMVEPAIIRGICAKIFLKEFPNSKVCYDIRPGKITKDMILENEGIPIVTKVGHSLIKEQAIREDAIFAGESSGHFFVKTDLGFFENPSIIILKILDYITKENKDFSEIVKPLKKYSHSGEINSVVENKEKVFKDIKEKYKDSEGVNMSELDGISIEFSDFWFNVRASNTEPKIRLNLEAINEKIMQEKRDEVLSIIKS